MALLRTKVKIAKVKNVENSIRLFSTQYKIPKVEDDFTKTPQYPPILDLSKKCVTKRKEETWYKKIQRQKTIEEKLFEINVPRYWGWNCLMLKEGDIPYNSLKFSQFVTRTHLIESIDLPENYISNKELSIKLVDDIKGCIEDELNQQLSLRRISKAVKSELNESNDNGKIIVNAINRILLRDVSNNVSHLEECEVDYSPRIEAFWSIGGIDPPDSVIKRRKAEKLPEDQVNEPIDRWVQYVGSPALQVRHNKQLRPFWGESVNGDVPVWTLDPSVLGYQNEYRHGTSIPGFWPGDQRDFSLLSFHLCNHLQFRPPSYGEEEKREALQAQGILSSFGWLVPLAAYHGFSPFSEITYPLVTQTILTDGKEFTFMVYQMNTNTVHSSLATENPKSNICWCSATENLYDCVENGKIKGLNEDVLSKIVLMYLEEPRESPGVNLRPYLGKDVQKVADIEEDERRCWLEKEFKHFSANRPRHRTDLMYELYEWERIYKVEHQKRPMDARRRPFELNQHPYRRKMSDHPGEYIPRAIRPDKDKPKKTQNKFRKTFYPQ